jgi:hypothetical protein
MLNQTRAHPRIARESKFQGRGISCNLGVVGGSVFVQALVCLAIVLALSRGFPTSEFFKKTEES